MPNRKVPDDTPPSAIVFKALDQLLRQAMTDVRAHQTAASLAFQVGLPEATITAFLAGEEPDADARIVMAEWASTYCRQGSPSDPTSH
jgi:hypothetical protein